MLGCITAGGKSAGSNEKRMKSMKWYSGFHSKRKALLRIVSVGIHITGVIRNPICNTEIIICRKSMNRVQTHDSVNDKKNKLKASKPSPKNAFPIV